MKLEYIPLGVKFKMNQMSSICYTSLMQNKRYLWALAFLVLAQFMIVLDISIVNVSLPSIQNTFNLNVGDLQGIVTAYTLAFGGFLLLGGRAADLYGRRRVFLIGVTGFI